MDFSFPHDPFPLRTHSWITPPWRPLIKNLPYHKKWVSDGFCWLSVIFSWKMNYTPITSDDFVGNHIETTKTRDNQVFFRNSRGILCHVPEITPEFRRILSSGTHAEISGVSSGMPAWVPEFRRNTPEFQNEFRNSVVIVGIPAWVRNLCIYDFGSKGAAFFSGVNGDKMPPQGD